MGPFVQGGSWTRVSRACLPWNYQLSRWDWLGTVAGAELRLYHHSDRNKQPVLPVLPQKSVLPLPSKPWVTWETLMHPGKPFLWLVSYYLPPAIVTSRRFVFFSYLALLISLPPALIGRRECVLSGQMGLTWAMLALVQK